MIELEKRQYSLVQKFLEMVECNTLFAHSVIAGDAEGAIYVDDTQNPTSFYIVHSYGMSLLFGDYRNKTFIADLFAYFMQKTRKREKHEWMQVYPREWDEVILPLVESNHVIRYNRINFAFDQKLYEKKVAPYKLYDYTIKPTSTEMFLEMSGSVIPRDFWINQQAFCESCKSYTIYVGNHAASTAFSSYRKANMLEIGIETQEQYRGQGLAKIACIALIHECLQEGLLPVWSCRHDNIGSITLAKSLGFKKVTETPYYHIPL